MTDEERRERKTVWSHGRKGDSDWMRVLVDSKADRVEVHYKNAQLQRRKEVFPGTTKKAKDSAVTWAETYRDERTRLGAARVDTTHAQLWQAYTNSPAWRNLRETTWPSYTDRWAKWMNFRGAATRVDETTLHHLDKYITNAIAAGMAVNQIRMVLNVARVVYNWGQTRKLVRENAFVGYRWTTPKDAKVNEPAEYSNEEYEKLLLQLSPQDGRRWRGWFALMIGGHQGQRANAVLNLRWDDVVGNELVWPRGLQKNGKELVQPLTWDAVAALETARYWRGALGYEGPWILFAGGGNKKLGAAVTRSASRRRLPNERKSTETMSAERKVRTDEQDTPYTYGGLWAAIHKAEERAGVTHREYRAFHGFRKMAAGNVADRTGDTRLAMEFIGDDIRQAPKYLKRRDERLERAAEAAATPRPPATATEPSE
ncbi:MAG: site-specific integrase [bacterium]